MACAVVSERMNKGSQWGQGDYLGLTEKCEAIGRSIREIFRTFGLYEIISVS